MDHKCSNFPHRFPLRSTLQAHKLALKRVYPKSLEFHLNESLEPHLFRKISKSFSKYTPKLKNPPIKQIIRQKNLTKKIKSLIICPDEALSYIKKIAIYFTRLHNLSIHNQDDSFAPMKIETKIPPIRSLKVFSHDHELCTEFMACAKYVTFLKIKKSSLNLEHLKYFQHLQTLYLICKAKFVAFDEDDKKFINKLASVLDSRLPALNRVILEHEINPENKPYVLLQLYHELKGRIKVDLVADLVDISNYRVQNNSIEAILKDISSAGIQDINISYAGIMKSVKKMARPFPVPIHLRKDIYARFLKSLHTQDFKHIQVAPAFHTSHLNPELQGSLLQLLELRSKVVIPKITLIYCLDTLDEDSFELLLSLYSDKIPFYEIFITNTTDLTHDQYEKLEDHYRQVLAKVKDYNIKFSISLAARTYKNLFSLTKIILPMSRLFLIKSFSVKIINPISKVNMKGLAKLFANSLASNSVSKLEMNISLKETPISQEIYETVGSILQKVPQLHRFTFVHQNTDEYAGILFEAFERLRKERFGVDLKYEANREKELIFE